MHRVTRTSVAGVDDLAKAMGVKRRAAQRRMRKLEQEYGVIRCGMRRCGRLSNLTNIYTFPILDENFLESRRHRGGVVDDTVIQSKILKPATTTTSAQAREECANLPIEVKSPERPKPDPAVWEAEETARRMREERRAREARKRQARYAEAQLRPRHSRSLGDRSQRHHEPPTPVREAAREVMRLLGISLPSWRLRLAIEGAVELCARREGRSPSCCVERLVWDWTEYQRESALLFMPVGRERFFGEGFWCDRESWRYDDKKLEQLRMSVAAAVGSRRDF